MPWTGAGVPRVRRAVGVAAAVVLVGAATTGWWATAPRRHVPVPPVAATPERVVQAYLAASTAHDVATMNALIAGENVVRPNRLEPTWLVSDVKTSTPYADPASAAAETWRQVVHVDVTMHVVRGHDLNFPDNTDTYWGYILARQTDRDPWRIVDQGVG